MMKPDLLSFDIAAGAGAPVAGMDEAGRGPLAGPVVAACVVMPPGDPVEGVNDSKKLTALRREKLCPAILRKALAVGVGWSSRAEIDEVNILNATRLAMRRAWKAMGASPPLLLVDAVAGLDLPVETRSIVGGDATSYNVAAASIVAKVTRDHMMAALDGIYPGYGFARHKGYGTEEHIAALRALGPCAEHRTTFIGGILGPSRKEKGRAGEDIAEKLLLSEGLTILERNWRTARGELDIVARDGNTLAFVEVKYRESGRFGAPREAVDRSKRRALTRMAQSYLQGAQRTEANCRFDVVEIVRCGGDYEIEYLRDAFQAEGGDFIP